MTEERYTEVRAALVSDIHFQLSRHCKLNARARIRKIAQLDYEQHGTPIETTKEFFNYNSLRT